MTSPPQLAETIVTASIGSAADLEELLGQAVEMACGERPFGVVTTVSGLDLRRHRSSFEVIRRMPGGRAHFGTWCRGVGYVFESAAEERAARQHLYEAPLLWGARIVVTHAGEDAAAWLRGELRR